MNQNPSISDPSLYQSVVPYLPSARPLSIHSADLIHAVGAYGSIGVEWFVAPKIALGANVNLGGTQYSVGIYMGEEFKRGEHVHLCN